MKKIPLLILAAGLYLPCVAQKNEIPPPPPPEPPKIELVKFDPQLASFHKRNKNVESVNWSDNGHTIILLLKNGKKESYDLSNEGQKKNFQKKYGQVPFPPPPPPPAPPRAA